MGFVVVGVGVVLAGGWSIGVLGYLVFFFFFLAYCGLVVVVVGVVLARGWLIKVLGDLGFFFFFCLLWTSGGGGGGCGCGCGCCVCSWVVNRSAW